MMILALHLQSRISVSSSDDWDWCHSNARHSFERESHWDIDCQLLVGESFTGFGSVIWGLGCVVSSSKHQRSRSLTLPLSLGGLSKRHCRSLVTLILVELQTAKSSSSSNEWMSESVDDDDESEIWIKYRGSLPRAYDSCECLSMVMIDWLIKCQLDQTNRYIVIDWLSEYLSCERLFACMNEVCTHYHSHSLTLRVTHTVMQVPKWRCSNQVSESVNEPAIGQVSGK